MKKYQLFLITILLTPIIAGLYGVIHDQFTYSISPEYFTKFKFLQFGLINEGERLTNSRLGAAEVGFRATWWTGIIIGLVNASVGLIHRKITIMRKAIINATFITMGVTLITSIFGLAFGGLYLTHHTLHWYFPADLIDRQSFVAVGSMHNFSYLGGIVGLLIGVFYQLVLRKQRQTKYRQHVRHVTPQPSI